MYDLTLPCMCVLRCFCVMQPKIFVSRLFVQSLLLQMSMSAHPCPKNRDSRPPKLLATDLEIGQHLIFSFLGPKLPGFSKKYPLLTGNRNEAIRYHYSPSI